MAVMGANYKGCTAIVKGSTKGGEMRTVILEHDTNFMTISVKGELGGVAIGEHVDILVLLPNSAHEYSGVLRRYNGTATTLTLYNGRVKESRGATRYSANSLAKVENLVYGEQLAPLHRPLKVLLVNISTSGALIRTKPNSFIKDATAELRVSTGDSETVVQGVVVRVHKVDENQEEYGVRFI